MNEVLTAPEGAIHLDGRVEIYDTDASGLIFYGAPVQWFCRAETIFVDRYDVGREVGQRAGPHDPFAVTRSVELSLPRPIGFLDHYDHAVWISKAGRSSYTMSHLITVGGLPAVVGEVRRVVVRRGEDGVLRPAPIAAALRRLCVPSGTPSDSEEEG